MVFGRSRLRYFSAAPKNSLVLIGPVSGSRRLLRKATPKGPRKAGLLFAVDPNDATFSIAQRFGGDVQTKNGEGR